jgi:O-antigen ligase
MAVSRERVTDGLFLAALFSVSFIGLRWQFPAFEPKLADFFIVGFLIAFLIEVGTRRLWRPGRPVIVVLGFAAALATVYLAALPVIHGRTELVQYSKGIGYFALHFAFLAAGVHMLALRSAQFFHVALGCLLVGIAANGAYAGLQLIVALTGNDLDAAVLSPLTGRPARSMSYGLMYGPDAFRARGLTRDPNHLGVMLLLPTLALLALSARPRGLRHPRVAAAVLAGLFVVLALTLSRSAAAGLAVGVLILALAYGRRLLRRGVVVPAAIAAGGLALVATTAETSERVVGARLGVFGVAGRQHFRTYELIRPALSEDPLFGIGLNNFRQTYAQRVLGNLEASHSFYVQSLVETGILGSVVFALFLAYVIHRLRLLRALEQSEDAQSTAALALATVLGAAFAGTLIANAFYMTMSFTYFYAFLIFVVAAATRFAPGTNAHALPFASPTVRGGRDRPRV